MLLTFIIMHLFHVRDVSYVSILKVKLVEDLISSDIEVHTFWPTNVREHFPEEELTLGKST